MPTAIRQVELSAPFADIGGLSGHTRCMLVFRWHDRVVGRTFVSLSGDRLAAS